MSNIPNNYQLEDDESLVIDLSVIANALRQHVLSIIGVTLLFAAVAAVYVFTLYQEKYVSEGTLLFNPTDLPKVISEVNTQTRFLDGAAAGGGGSSNPFKNQQELLKSHLIAKKTLALIKAEGIDLKVKKPQELLDKVLSSNHVTSTDFIKVTATSPLPSVSQKIAKAYMNSYLDIIHEISYSPLLQQRELFKKQLAQVDTDLQRIDDHLQAYQEEFGIIDLSMESQAKVSQQEDLQQQLKKADVELAEKKAESSQLLTQLKLKPTELAAAIQSVAGGQDAQMSALQTKLQDAQEEYNTKALVYSPTNPDMKQLAEKIAVLNKQITDQQILTIGQVVKPKSLLIKDPLRADMVNRLVVREAEISALKHKRGTLDNQYQHLVAELKSIPRQQLEYTRMKLDKQHKETLQNLLRDKLSEIKIQEAAIQKKLMIIDQPSLPDSPLFPTRFHIIALSALAGVLLSSLAVAARAVWQPKTVTPHSVESLLNIPVLSVIPWLSERKWRQCRSRRSLEVISASPDSDIVKAYQSLSLNLKLQKNATGKNALAISSMYEEAGQSFILANMALCLAQSGDNVVLIDANLKGPRLNQLFGHALSFEHGLTEVINTLSEVSANRGQLNTQELLPIVQNNLFASGVHPQLTYLNAGVTIDNTFEFLNSRGFAALVAVLKTHYDWVLFDAPPFIADIDTSVLLANLDGLVLFVERGSDEEQLREVKQKMQRLNSSLIGCVLRGEEKA